MVNYVLKESENVILYEVFKTIWTRVRTCQNGHATPLIFSMLPLELKPFINFVIIFT